MPRGETGRLIADERGRRGLSQVALAEQLGVAASTVADWERGDAYPVKKRVLVEDFLQIRLPDRPDQDAAA